MFDMVIYDWVEVLCGVIGLMVGVGEFLVVVNMVCKMFIVML